MRRPLTPGRTSEDIIMSGAFRLNKQLFNPALYARIREVWFQGLPESATVAPPELNSKRWFMTDATPEEKLAFDSVCTVSFRAALDSVGPASFAIPPAATWLAEMHAARAVAAPFLEEITAAAGAAAAESGEAKPLTALSLVLLLDQMPRNIFRRDQAIIYNHYDRIARALVHSLILEPASSGASPNGSPAWRPDMDPAVRLRPVFRKWFYMPLMHSEHIEDHDAALRLTAGMRDDVAAAGDNPALADCDMQDAFERRHYVLIERFGRYPHRNDELGRESTEEEVAFLRDGGDSFGTKS